MNDNDITGQTVQQTAKKDENFTNNKEDEFPHGKHPNSIKALKKHQYPKGVSGNIMGRKPSFEALANELKKLKLKDIIK